jgi:hypothetical protein
VVPQQRVVAEFSAPPAIVVVASVNYPLCKGKLERLRRLPATAINLSYEMLVD